MNNMSMVFPPYSRVREVGEVGAQLPTHNMSAVTSTASRSVPTLASSSGCSQRYRGRRQRGGGITSPLV
jgi:hypothetical protein